MAAAGQGVLRLPLQDKSEARWGDAGDSHIKIARRGLEGFLISHLCPLDSQQHRQAEQEHFDSLPLAEAEG